MRQSTLKLVISAIAALSSV